MAYLKIILDSHMDFFPLNIPKDKCSMFGQKSIGLICEGKKTNIGLIPSHPTGV